MPSWDVYLALYQIENIDNGEITEIIIPRVLLPIYPSILPYQTKVDFNQDNIYGIPLPTHPFLMFNFGLGELEVEKDRNDCYFIAKQVKAPDPIDMSIEDIEKLVGRPVRIVNKKA